MARHRLGLIAAAVFAGSMLWAQPSFGACGSWQKSPAAPGIRGVLSDVSATSATNVWAVGTTPFRDGSRTLAERWNGVAWKHVATPNPGRRSLRRDQLFTVAAISPTDVWAIGAWGINGTAPLLLHWNGVKWQRHQVPLHARHAQLFDMVAISPNDILAVGDTAKGNLRSLHYNGSTWRAGGPDFSDGRRPGLLAVAATAPSDVWAVGHGFGPFFVHFNGASVWTESPPSRTFGTEVGVAATSTTDAWGVGTYKLGSAIDHWNGTGWAVVLKTTKGPLLAVAASATTDVWVVGSGRSHAGPATAHWNGTTWAQGIIPTIDQSTLRAIVNVPTTTTYWAVGDTQHHPAGDSYRTPLIESRC